MTGHRDFVIRDAVTADALPFSRLRGDVVAEGRWMGTEPPLDIEKAVLRFHELLADANSHGSMAEDASGVIIGGVTMFTVLPGVTTFGMLVAPGWRQRGVGSALVGAVIAWSRGIGAHKVILEVWPHNTAAIALYKSCGFRQEGVRPKHYRRRNGELWDIVEMGLILASDPA